MTAPQPNRAIIFAVGALVAYVIMAMLISAAILRDVFNSLAFGTALLICITWFNAAVRAVREGAGSGEWQLILAIFVIWTVTFFQRSYVAAFNFAGRPESWSQTAITGFWPYSYFMAGLLFLVAPGIKADGMRSQALWAVVAAVAIGCTVAGILIGMSISTV